GERCGGRPRDQGALRGAARPARRRAARAPRDRAAGARRAAGVRGDARHRSREDARRGPARRQEGQGNQDAPEREHRVRAADLRRARGRSRAAGGAAARRAHRGRDRRKVRQALRARPRRRGGALEARRRSLLTDIPRVLRSTITSAVAGAWLAANAARVPAPPPPSAVAGSVAILAYHRFEESIHDSMAVKTSAFAAQLRYLAEHHYQVIPLRTLVSAMIEGKPLSNAVVITVDDGHRSVYTDMLPLVREYRVPVTVFIYPSAISNASYAMTWRQVE